jgi:NADH:ubiquinone oxidoreductase subunit 2 (subunit N)
MVVKPALFLLAAQWGGGTARLAGAAKVSPLGAGLFVLLALSLIGVPPLPGFWAKLLVLSELVRQAGSLYLLGGGVILAAAVLEVNYLFRVAASMYQPGDQAPGVAAPRGNDLAIASGLGVVVLAAGVLIAPLGATVEHIATQAADVPQYVHTVSPEALP